MAEPLAACGTSACAAAEAAADDGLNDTLAESDPL
jgi:diaminopimelate epimerase